MESEKPVALVAPEALVEALLEELVAREASAKRVASEDPDAPAALVVLAV